MTGSAGHSGPVTAIQGCSSRVWTAGGESSESSASLIEWAVDGHVRHAIETDPDLGKFCAACLILPACIRTFVTVHDWCFAGPKHCNSIVKFGFHDWCSMPRLGSGGFLHMLPVDDYGHPLSLQRAPAALTHCTSECWCRQHQCNGSHAHVGPWPQSGGSTHQRQQPCASAGCGASDYAGGCQLDPGDSA